MSTLNISVVDMLFQSSSISKGIEKVLDYLGDTFSPEYIGLIEDKKENVIINYEWTNPQHMAKEIHVDEYIEIIKTHDHFSDSEIFFRSDFSQMSIEEKSLYEKIEAKAVLEYELRDVGKTIGYMIYIWCDKDLIPELVDIYDMHIVTKLINENVRREIKDDRFVENEVNTSVVLNQLPSTSVYVVDDDFQLLYANETFKKNVPHLVIGEKCYETILGKSVSCRSCLKAQLNNNENAKCVIYVPNADKKINMTMKDIVYGKDKKAYVVACTDHVDELDKKSNEKTFRRMALAFKKDYIKVLEVNSITDSYVDISKGKELQENQGSFTTDILYYFERRITPEVKIEFFKLFEREHLIQMFKKGQTILDYEFSYTRDTNDEYWMCIRIILIEGAFDKDDTYFVCIKDINEIKQNQIKKDIMIDTEIMTSRSTSEAKSAVLEKLSHNIRTPMNKIVGMTSIAKKMSDNREKVEVCLEEIEEASNYLLKLLDDMMDMSRFKVGDFIPLEETFLLDSLINEVDIAMRPIALAKLVSINIENTYKEWFIITDRYRLYQALVKLVTNAIDLSVKGDTVTVKIEQIAVEKERVFLRFSVKNTGKSIMIKNQQKIFRACETADMNLVRELGEFEVNTFVAYKIISVIGGKIGIDSREGVGTEVYFTLNLKTDGTNEKKPKEFVMSKVDTSTMNFHGMRALIAEDEKMNAETMKALLEVVGFQVEKVSNGKQAVINFIAKEKNHYDVILLDIHMPVMDGREAAKCIRISGKDDAEMVPIIGLTANTFSDDEQKSKDYGMNLHMSKPIDADYLYQSVTNLIQERKVLEKEIDRVDIEK